MQNVDKVSIKKQKITKNLLIILLVMGIISILLGIASLPTQFVMLKNYVNKPDPKDYYGKYYAFTGLEIVTLVLNEDNTCGLSIDDGIENQYNKFEYRYLTSSQSKNKHLSIFPSIEIYQKAYGKEFTVLTFIVLTKDPYRFFLLEAPSFFTEEELTFENIMKDPKNFYGDFVCGNKSISVRKTGDVFLREYRKGNLIIFSSYTYKYMNENWVKIKFPGMKKCKGALIIKSTESSIKKVVFIINEETLYFEGETYYKE